MKQLITMIRFWIISFSVIIYNCIKGNEWHMIYADFHFGDDDSGRPIRKQLIAKRKCGELAN